MNTPLISNFPPVSVLPRILPTRKRTNSEIKRSARDEGLNQRDSLTASKALYAIPLLTAISSIAALGIAFTATFTTLVGGEDQNTRDEVRKYQHIVEIVNYSVI